MAALAGELSAFVAPPRLDIGVHNGSRTDIEQKDVDGKPFAVYALPVEQRPSSDFIWQRNPFKLDGGANPNRQYPGIDVFLPYWMGRKAGVLTVPGDGDANGDRALCITKPDI